MRVTFITGNQKKADYMAKLLNIPIEHHKFDLDEIQSLDLREIVEHKVRQAYERIKSPVIVEDVGLEFKSLGGLPGPFIKWFMQQMTSEQICALVDGQDREAIGRCVIGYYDGKNVRLFESSMKGRVPQKPHPESRFGWDNMFIPEGYEVTRAELSEADNRRTYLKIKPIEQLRQFLESQA